MDRFLLSLVIVGFSMQALALNFSFFKNSALSKFTKEEMASFQTFVGDSLSNEKDGEIIRWQSESGDLNASVWLKATYQNKGNITCRRVLFKVSDRNTSPEKYRFDLCHLDDYWQFAQTPVASFTTGDWRYIEQVFIETLDNEADGNPVSWHYPKTRNSGVVTPLHSNLNNDGLPCRDMAISFINNQGHSSDARYVFCQDNKGEWSRHIE